MPLSGFHPIVRAWFESTFREPTAPQRDGWPAIASGRDTLIAAPTGSGKTLAAFLWCIDQLVVRGARGPLPDATQVLYVSPLKALGNDVHRNLDGPLAGIAEAARRAGIDLSAIRTAVRTGDTPPTDRAKMARRPPHILITTPESLYILLTAERSRAALRSVRTVIVDEIHAVAGDKRGAHLALSLERLEWLADERPVRIGLSATQRPIDEIARLLVGTGRPPPVVVDAGQRRDLDLAIEVTDDELGAVATTEQTGRVYDRVAELVAQHGTTLVFVNTRRLVERVAHALAERLGADQVVAHHGSLSRKTRLIAEQRLKRGQVRCAVATASLELGIDVGAVDLVVQIGSPRTIATLVQRIGRSGHCLGATPKGRLFALTRDQLVECAALVRAVRAGQLDRVHLRPAPRDVLAQQIVAAVACEPWDETELWRAVRRAYPYRDLSRDTFDAVVDMLSEGVALRRGRSAAHLHRDRVNGRLRARRGARLAAITSGGAIPDNANYAVVQLPEETPVGTVDEDFAIESLPGDVFLLGNTSWRVRRVAGGKVYVEDAAGAAPSVPFWFGEAPARTAELSAEVAAVRRDVQQRLDRGDAPDAIAAWLADGASMSRAAARQLVDYLAASRAALGELPTGDTIVAERFFDEAGGMQLVLHAPVGARINKAWGLALRKKFCRNFNFELQAAATDDGVVISLGPMHSFPLDAVFDFVHPDAARETLIQAVLQAPLFGTRWRWNATRALAVLRRAGGKKVPPYLLRMRSDDLLAAVFPDAQACQDNLVGPRRVPDHPLVAETLDDCLTEAMDVDGLERLLRAIRAGEVRAVARDTPEPSPLSHELLNANPYAFLDDAPLEERRTRAVSLRRGLAADVADDLGRLDPDAIAEVADQAAPVVRDADELHDALLSAGWLAEPPRDRGWHAWFDALAADGRAARLRRGDRAVWVAAERLALARALAPGASVEPDLHPPFAVAAVSAEEAAVAIVRGHLECGGPTTARALARQTLLPPAAVDAALAALEAEGAVLRGQFTERSGDVQWCDRRILARIHRLTLHRLRREVEPVSAADFMRFLFRWQHVADGTRLTGVAGTAAVVDQLQGFEAAAAAWEREILPARVRGYRPEWIDRLCWSGEIAWGRLSARAPARRPAAPTRAAPIAVVSRNALDWLLRAAGARGQEDAGAVTAAAADVLAWLRARGASFAPEIAAGTGRLPAEVEDALWELVATGRATADGFAGLRALLDRSGRGRRPAYRRGGRARFARRTAPEGRWALLPDPSATPATESADAGAVDAFARQLLARYGVVFRDLLARETLAPAWRDLVGVLRRLEARGELRGGRFVGGFAGEQYALPEAVDALRAVRRDRGESREEEFVRVAATDPLNLVGITSPGPRVAAVLGNAVLYRDGVPVASTEAGELVVRRPLGDGVRVDRRLRVQRAAS